jgi:hypothetical protein
MTWPHLRAKASDVVICSEADNGKTPRTLSLLLVSWSENYIHNQEDAKKG